MDYNLSSDTYNLFGFDDELLSKKNLNTLKRCIVVCWGD